MARDYFQKVGFNRQLFVVLVISVLCLASLTSIVASRIAEMQLEKHLLGQYKTITENLAKDSLLALVYGSADNINQNVALTMSYPDVDGVRVIDTSGRVLISNFKEGARPAVETAAILAAGLTEAKLISSSDGQWAFVAPVFSKQFGNGPFDSQEDKVVKMGYAQVVFSKAALHRLSRIIWTVNFFIALSVAIPVLFVLRALTKRMLRPLNSLSSLMRRARDGESGMRATLGGPRDFVDMAQDFNKMMDVLEEREEELTRSRDEAVQAAVMKGQFAATITHEVRTPLNGVVGMLELLKEMPLGPRQKECALTAYTSARSLVELTNGVLDFSKIEAGKMELDVTDFDPRALVVEVCDLFEGQAKLKGVRVDASVSPIVPEAVAGDPLRLRQILTNLMGNAVKFTDAGVVTIKVSCESSDESMIRLRFEVVDTGIGLSETEASKVFESYVQASQEMSKKYGGTGLGLAIVKKLVSLMKGEIGVASKPGEGSTFWFTVPFHHSQFQYELGGEESIPAVLPRILVASESEAVRSLLLNTLALSAGDVTGVPPLKVQVALEEASSIGRPYQVVVMDSEALDEAGAYLITKIGPAIQSQGSKILLLNRYGMGAGTDLAGAAVLSPPLSRERIRDAVRRALLQEGQIVFPAAELEAGSGQQEGSLRTTILVVEDNRVNQAVVCGMLDAFGCEIVVVDDGKAAVEMCLKRRFDMILMDCNMPRMDGYEATAHIRRHEEQAGIHTPIMALTANSQQGDVEKCLAAGMDDYMSKPISIEPLQKKLERWIGPIIRTAIDEEGCETGQLNLDTDPSPSAAALDSDVLEELRRVMGASLSETLRPFLEDMVVAFNDLEEAILMRQGAAVARVAHSIRGSSSNVGATGLAAMARRVEQLAVDGEIEECQTLLPRLRKAFDEVAPALRYQAELVQRSTLPNEGDAPLILVVDDDRSTRNALRVIVQREGFIAEEACDGAEAVNLVRRRQPDLILMDAVMPEMDGFAACAQIQDLSYGRPVPVLMITALDDIEDVERAFAAGASDFIPKPIHYSVLVQRIKTILAASQAQRKVQQMTGKDPLTGLPNRAMFFEHGTNAIGYAKRHSALIAVCSIDIDQFKYVNETYGHQVGDQLLAAFAHRLVHCTRSSDFVSRIGGDQFALLITGETDVDAITIMMENIMKAMANRFELEDEAVSVTTTVGVSLFPYDGDDIGILLKHADAALYKAKKSSTPLNFYASAIEKAISEASRLGRDLQDALVRNQFSLKFLPQIESRSGMPVCAEAQLLWNHPTKGVLTSMDFFTAAEESSLILPLGKLAMRLLFDQVERWAYASDSRCRVSILTSLFQVLDRDFVNWLVAELESRRISAEMLELEIAEGPLIDHVDASVKALEGIRRAGIRVSISNFGTGFSPAGSLRFLKVDTIKIDSCFIRNLPEDSEDSAITKKFILEAHENGILVVATGVETIAQVDFLKQHGCDLLQGPVFVEPLDGTGILEYIHSTTPERKAPGDENVV